MTQVSVIIPTRNRSRLLATTLRSVLRQRDVDLEVIVVDDASTDDTVAVANSFADGRVRVVSSSQAGGPAAARNRGAAAANGEWIGFVDDDDVWAPHKLAAQLAALRRAGSSWAYAGAVNIGSDLEIISSSPPPSADTVVAAVRRYNPIPAGGSNVIVSHALLRKVGGFDERLPPCEDWELWIRLAQEGPPAVAAEPVIGYRLHAGNSSLDLERIIRAVKLIEQLHHTRADWGRVHRWLAESCLRNERQTMALREFAKAAVRGQARGVAADLGEIVKRRIARRLGVRNATGSMPQDEWVATAPLWLTELKS